MHMNGRHFMHTNTTSRQVGQLHFSEVFCLSCSEGQTQHGRSERYLPGERKRGQSERETKRGRKEDRENERERAIKREKGGREAVVKN